MYAPGNSGNVPVPQPLANGSSGARTFGGVDGLVPAQGPFPFPQSFGPSAAAQPDHYRLAFGPQAVSINEGPAVRIKRTNLTVLANVLLRPWRVLNWHQLLREGMLVWALHGAEVKEGAMKSNDNSQEVRTFAQLNYTLRKDGKAAYKKLMESQLAGTHQDLRMLPEIATAKEWNVRATTDAKRRFNKEFYALTTYGIIERFGALPMGVTYTSPNVNTHFAPAPGSDKHHGVSFSQTTIAVKGVCNLLCIWEDVTSFSNLFIVLRRARRVDGSWDNYMEYVPIATMNPNLDVEDLMYPDILTGTWQMGLARFIGTVQDLRTIAPSGENARRVQGRTDESPEMHFDACMSLGIMGVTLMSRHNGYLAHGY